VRLIPQFLRAWSRLWRESFLRNHRFADFLRVHKELSHAKLGADKSPQVGHCEEHSDAAISSIHEFEMIRLLRFARHDAFSDFWEIIQLL